MRVSTFECISFLFLNQTVVEHHSPHLNEFVASPQEQNIHHQHQHHHHQQHQHHPQHQQHQHSMIEPEKVNEIPNQTEIKQVTFASRLWH